MTSLIKLKNIWKEYGFEIAVVVSVAFIVLYSMYRKSNGIHGSWSPVYSYQPNTAQKTPKSPPKESKGELECRRVLQKIFGKPFYKARPDFLRNPVTGGNFNLELDCFNNEMGLAVEYQGSQHYKYIPYFHKNKATFRNQQYRDEMKRVKCKQNGITLIEVPHTVKLGNIEVFLITELRSTGYLNN
jgi:hypothetical protein